MGLVYREAFFLDVCQRVEANAAYVSYVEVVAPLGFGIGLEAGDVYIHKIRFGATQVYACYTLGDHPTMSCAC